MDPLIARLGGSGRQVAVVRVLVVDNRQCIKIFSCARQGFVYFHSRTPKVDCASRHNVAVDRAKRNIGRIRKCSSAVAARATIAVVVAAISVRIIVKCNVA